MNRISGYILLILSVVFIGLIYLYFTSSISNSKEVKNTAANSLPAVKRALTFSDYLTQDLLVNIDEKYIDFDLEIVEKQRYEHSSAFVFEYTGQCIKEGSNIKPNGLVSATNIGINPKNGKAFQTKIEGVFQNGLPNGYCIVYYPEGPIYKGMMKDGEMNENGKYYETKDSKPINLECKNGNCVEI
jgi:hypothetical protein